MSKFTVPQIEQIVGAKGIELSKDGKWLVCDQRGSKGVMELLVGRCKAAGLPAFFSPGQRKFGVLAEQVEA